MNNFITIDNNGPDIIATNYWTSEQARAGFLFLSINAGAFRLMVPAAQEAQIAEMRTAKEVIVSRGPWPDRGRHDALELLFEDFTASPYSIHLGTDQCDRLPVPADRHKEHTFTIWTSAGKQFECPAWYRIVKRLPCLNPRKR
jgi:hypothetical protein